MYRVCSSESVIDVLPKNKMGNSQSQALLKNLNQQQVQAWQNLQIENQRLKQEFDIICTENAALKHNINDLSSENVLATLELNSKEVNVKSHETEDKSCNTDHTADGSLSHGVVGSLGPATEPVTSVNVHQELTEIQELLNQKNEKIDQLQKSLSQTKLEFEEHKKKTERVKSDCEVTLAEVTKKLNTEVNKTMKISEQANIIKQMDQCQTDLNEVKEELRQEREKSRFYRTCHEHTQKQYEEILAESSDQLVQIKRLQKEVDTLDSKLTNECLVSGSSQAQVAQLKQQIADMAENFRKETSHAHQTELQELQQLLREKDEKIISLEKSLEQSSSVLQESQQYVENTEKVLSEQKALVTKLSTEIKKKTKKITAQANQIKSLEKANESKLDVCRKEAQELKQKLEHEKTRLVNECLLSGSRQSHIDQLKQQIAAMTESSKSTSKLSSQLSKKANEISALKKEVEAKKKKVENLKSIQSLLQTENAGLRNQKAVHQKEIKKYEASLEMALNSEEVDVVSVHLVAEIYKLYKEKAKLLENATVSQTSSAQKSISNKSVQVLSEPSSIEPKQEFGNGGATVSTFVLCTVQK